MHSLQSYGQEDPVFDNSAYTVSSIYHGGQLKMFTSHPSKPVNPGNRPIYYTNQVNAWSMTGNVETFRQGATYFRNGRDWTKEQRDEAIRLANERVGESQAGALPVDASFGHTFVLQVKLQRRRTTHSVKGLGTCRMKVPTQPSTFRSLILRRVS